MDSHRPKTIDSFLHKNNVLTSTNREINCDVINSYSTIMIITTYKQETCITMTFYLVFSKIFQN